MVPICLLSSGVLHGQTVTSNGTASYNGGNGVGAGGGITFTVENLSGGDILITDLEAYWQTGQNGVIPTLRVRNVGASGSYAPFVAGDWTTIAVGSAVAVPANGYYPTLSGLSYLLPNGTAKQFMLEGSNGIRYSGTGAITPNSFTTAGVSIRNGDYQIASLNVGYGGIVSGTANTPRYFTGGITFMPAAACTGIPTAGAISGSSQVCTGGSTTLSVVGSSVGTGITRNWFSSLVSGGPYTTPVGSGLSVNSGAITANTYFVCEVTCTNSGQTATTSEFLVSPIGASPGGTYTIDNTLPSGGSNFNNFTDAINTLNSLGLCGAFTGPWVFNVVAGQTFNENPPQVTASGDAVNTITFQRSGAGANPVVTPTGGGGTTDFGLGIRGGNYITFDGIDIDGGSAVEFGYYIANVSATVSSNNNTIQNCTIHLDRTNTASRGIICTSSTTGGGFTPTAASGSNSNNHFFNFTIEDVYAGIFVTSGTTLWPGIGNIAGTTGGGNSTIGAAYVGTPPGDLGGTATATWGVQFLNQVDVQIFDITVQNITGTGINRGIWFGGAGGNSVVHGNRVRGIRNTSTTGTSAQRGIDVGQLTTGTHSLRVYNNFVSDITAAHATTATATRVVQGIFTSNGAAGMTYEIDFNSVALDGLGSSSASNACLEFSVATSVNIARNNSLANFTGAQAGVAVHFAIRTAGTTTLGAAGSLSDYNNLYVANATNGFAGQTATVNHPNIADWTAALSGTPGTDANSISADPIYFDNNLDLHASGPALDGAGLPGGLAWVTVDIDGDTRNDPPDIGGDEFAPASCFPPTDVAVVVNSTSTATITWTNVAALNYDWEVRSSGAPGSGPAGLEDSGNVLAAPVNLTGLPSATVFAAYVRCNCTGPLTSNWSAAVAFETPGLVGTFPYCEDFESATLCVPSTCLAGLACTSSSLDPVLWENATTDGLAEWSVDEGGTSSTGTGPGTGAGTGQPDYFPGTITGNYLYIESGVPCNGVEAIALSPVFDISSFTNPNVRAQMAYNMFGATMGTMSIDIEDPALSGTWTTLWTLSGDQGQGWFLTPTLDHVYSGTQVRYRVRGLSGSNFTSDMAFDYFCVSEGPLCTAPIASVTAVTANCLTNTMSIDVNVTSLGDATSVTVQYSVNAGPYLTACNLVAPGPCSITGLSTTAVVNVQVVHDQDNVCSIDLGNYALNDLTCITCGDPAVVENYCYVASDDKSWHYVASGGGTLKLKFNRGTLESNAFDDLTIYDGPDNTYPILFANPANTGNLGPAGSAILNTDPDFFAVDVTATGADLFMTLTTDGSVQCATSTTYDPWEWEVLCLNCIQPSVSTSIVEDCFGGSFTVEVTVSNTGDGATVDLESVPGSVEHNDVPASATPYVMGPYLNGSTVNIFVRHENDATCDLDLGTFESTCPPIIDTYPYCEDFESANLCVPSTCVAVLACTSTALDPVGWQNSTTDGSGQWSVDEGGTSSTSTGPGTGAGTGQPDYVPGTSTGNYVYMESGSCAGNTIEALSPIFDVSVFPNPAIRARMAYNMFGATMGTLAIDIEDPALSNNWTNLWSLSGDQGQGWFLTPNLDHVYTGTAVRYRVRGVSGTSFTSDMAFDYFCVRPTPLCFDPIASVTSVVPDCNAGTLTLDVDVTSLGDATTVTVEYALNGGSYVPGCVLGAPGICQIVAGAADVVSVRVVHNQDGDCGLDLGDHDSGGVYCITCGAPVVQSTYCYVADDNQSWLYESNGGGTLLLEFIRGTLETNSFDDLTIYDGPDNTYPILFANPANTGNLGPAGSAILNTDPDFFAVNVTATGNSLYMTLTTDGSVQCATSTTYDPWVWEVVCLDCSYPVATAAVVNDCPNAQYFVSVDITDAGSGGMVDIVSNLNGLEANDVGVGVHVVGPFANGTPVIITLVHPDNTLCNLELGSFFDCCQGTCAFPNAAVVGTNTNGPITCGSPTQALVNGTVPTGARWWTYTLPANGKVRVSSCTPPNSTNDDTFVTIHEGVCGSLVPYTGDDDGCTAFNFASDVTFIGSAGQTFHIEWDNRYNGTAHDWDLTFTACTPPANDLCAS
ncbi:MAG: hypothetical protein KA817_10215, partial [Flavobacteriales bacterium]|nr:hypothetical protein [Flavobacteriales bacterium]